MCEPPAHVLASCCPVSERLGGLTDLHPLGRSFVRTLLVHQVHPVGGHRWFCVPLDMFTGNRWLLHARFTLFPFFIQVNCSERSTVQCNSAFQPKDVGHKWDE